MFLWPSQPNWGEWTSIWANKQSLRDRYLRSFMSIRDNTYRAVMYLIQKLFYGAYLVWSHFYIIPFTVKINMHEHRFHVPWSAVIPYSVIEGYQLRPFRFTHFWALLERQSELHRLYCMQSEVLTRCKSELSMSSWDLEERKASPALRARCTAFAGTLVLSSLDTELTDLWGKYRLVKTLFDILL